MWWSSDDGVGGGGQQKKKSTNQPNTIVPHPTTEINSLHPTISYHNKSTRNTKRMCVCVCLPFHHHHKKNIETGNKWMNEKKTASHLSLANTHSFLLNSSAIWEEGKNNNLTTYMVCVCARFIQVVFVIFVIVIISLWDFKTMNLLGSLLTEKWINGVVSMVNDI